MGLFFRPRRAGGGIERGKADRRLPAGENGRWRAGHHHRRRGTGAKRDRNRVLAQRELPARNQGLWNGARSATAGRSRQFHRRRAGRSSGRGGSACRSKGELRARAKPLSGSAQCLGGAISGRPGGISRRPRETGGGANPPRWIGDLGETRLGADARPGRRRARAAAHAPARPRGSACPTDGGARSGAGRAAGDGLFAKRRRKADAAHPGFARATNRSAPSGGELFLPRAGPIGRDARDECRRTLAGRAAAPRRGGAGFGCGLVCGACVDLSAHRPGNLSAPARRRRPADGARRHFRWRGPERRARGGGRRQILLSEELRADIKVEEE